MNNLEFNNTYRMDYELSKNAEKRKALVDDFKLILDINDENYFVNSGVEFTQYSGFSINFMDRQLNKENPFICLERFKNKFHLKIILSIYDFEIENENLLEETQLKFDNFCKQHFKNINFSEAEDYTGFSFSSFKNRININENENLTLNKIEKQMINLNMNSLEREERLLILRKNLRKFKKNQLRIEKRVELKDSKLLESVLIFLKEFKSLKDMSN